MNKQELIEKYKSALNKVHKVYGDYYKTEAYEEVLKDLKQLDEPDKPVVPQFVADWIEKCKSEKRRLHESLTYTPYGVNGWISNPKNQEIFARAWLDGYETEEEKRYMVKVKGVCFNSCLIFEKINKTWLFSSIYEIDHQRGNHTRKELEEAGFGEVFNSPLFEVEEVEG